MAITKLQRQLDLIAYLVGRRLPVAVEELMEQVPGYAEKWQGSKTDQATARRTFERDKDELRQFGIPMRTVKYTVSGQDLEGYAIDRRDFYLPYLKLVNSNTPSSSQFHAPNRIAELEVSEEDAPLALNALRRVADIPGFPLRAEARSAFRKLAYDLDPAVFASEPRVAYADHAENAELAAVLRVLSDAVIARKRVGFRYHGIYRGEETARQVHGYGMMFQSGQWYLIGYDLDRQDIRVFRASRMDDVAINKHAPNTADYEVPADFDLKPYIGRQPWELGDQDEAPLEVRVRFKFPLSLWAERNDHGELEERDTDGATVRSFEVHQVNPFLRWILSMQSEAQIVEPRELQRELKSLAQRVLASHSEAAHGDH